MVNRKDFLIKNISELFRYGVVGILRTIIGLIIIFVPYNYWGVNYILCNIISYIVGLLVGFILHKNWVFKSNGSWKNESVHYVITFGISYIINIIVLLLYAEIFSFNKNISQVFAIVGFIITNYSLNKFWTFGTKKK